MRFSHLAYEVIGVAQFFSVNVSTRLLYAAGNVSFSSEPNVIFIIIIHNVLQATSLLCLHLSQFTLSPEPLAERCFHCLHVYTTSHHFSTASIDRLTIQPSIFNISISFSLNQN